MAKGLDGTPRECADGVPWTLTLEEGVYGGLGGVKPRVLLAIGEGEDTRRIPKAVARALEKDAKEWTPTCRAELLHRVGELSRSCAAQRLYGLVAQRDYGREEAARRLRGDGYSQSVVDAVVERAVAGHLLDDHRFVEGFVNAKLGAGWGRRRIERELESRGVDLGTIPGWPGAFFGEDDEMERAWGLVERRSVPAKDPFGKTVRFLVNRGFGAEVAYGCARRLMEELEDPE